MKTTILAALATAALFGCSSNPEPTSAEPMPTQAAQTDMPAPEPAPPAASDAAATGSTPTAAPAAAPPPEPAADIAVAPMKVSFEKTTLELKADKGIYFKGKKIAAFEKNVLQLVEMKDNMAVMKDGSVMSTPEMPKKVRFNDKDELEIEGGGKIAVDDKGNVTMTPPDGKEMPKDAKPKITGFKPEARRAATLALMLAMMTMGEAKAAPPATSSAPPAPPAPKK